jgi:flagellar biosynthesis activator protein FlaF
VNEYGRNAYRKVQRDTCTPRENEARVLTIAAVKLAECRDDWQGARVDDRLMEALKYNQKIWSIFQSQLAGPESPLPGELRLNLLRLGAIVDRQIFSIMAHPQPEKLTSIIEINLGLASGLGKKCRPGSTGAALSSGSEAAKPSQG